MAAVTAAVAERLQSERLKRQPHSKECFRLLPVASSCRPQAAHNPSNELVNEKRVCIFGTNHNLSVDMDVLQPLLFDGARGIIARLCKTCIPVTTSWQLQS